MSAEAAHILKKKEAILSLEKFLDRKIVAILDEQEEVHGILKGFDNNINLVLADAELWAKSCIVRKIGACVMRGGHIASISSGDMVILTSSPF
ncbi:unnamed protein product [Phytomonas sp. Hart1]|nr:unnamed protein product [Phytomonas sp. Hart1]|eukprot:CCW66109.1 unnamed protein product [Phytomonas sp. isolate Hart1]